MIKIHSVESLGTFDGPGVRMVLFLQGCNFKCLYCANPDTIDVTGESKLYDYEELMKLARSQRPFFGKKGGITMSGGEPLMQAKAIIPYFKLLKDEGFNTCLDTNGSYLNDSVKELLRYTDLVLLDFKEINDEAHKKITGMTNLPTLKFANYLQEINKPTWARYVLVPGYTDNENDLHKLGQFLQPMDNVQKIEIQPYHKLGKHKYKSLGWEYQLEDVEQNTAEQLIKAKDIFQLYIKEVIVN